MPGATRREMLNEPFLGESIENLATSKPERSMALIWDTLSGPKNVINGEIVGSLLGGGSWAIMVAIIVALLRFGQVHSVAEVNWT